MELEKLKNSFPEVSWQDGAVELTKGVIFKKKINVPISEFDAISIEDSYRSGGADGDYTERGYELWLHHPDKEKSVRVLGYHQGEIQVGTNDSLIYVRSKAEELAVLLNLPIQSRSEFSLVGITNAYEVNTPYHKKINTALLAGYQLKNRFHPKIKVRQMSDHVKLSRDTRTAATLWGAAFWVVAIVLYIILGWDYIMLSGVLAWMGLIVAVLSGFVEQLEIYEDKFVYSSKGRLGFVKSDKEIPKSRLEMIAVMENPGLNGQRALTMISDDEVIYFATGFKSDVLKDLLVFTSWAVLDWEKVMNKV